MQTDEEFMATLTKERAERADADLAAVERTATLTCDTSIEDMSRRVMLAVRYALSVTPTAYGDEHGRDQARIVAEMEALRGAVLNDWLRGLVRAAVSREVARQALGVVS